MRKRKIVRREIKRLVNGKPYLTKQQVAQKYDVHIRTVERWSARKWVRSETWGNRRWYEEEQLERDLIACGYVPRPRRKK